MPVGLCTCFGLWRGGGSWAHDPGPKSDPKVWATRGVPHYGVPLEPETGAPLRQAKVAQMQKAEVAVQLPNMPWI